MSTYTNGRSGDKAATQQGEEMETMKMNGMPKSLRMSRTARFSTIVAVVGSLTLLVGTAGAPNANAQAGTSVNSMIETRANMQAKNLGLTPDQTKQLVQINTAAVEQVKALRAN